MDIDRNDKEPEKKPVKEIAVGANKGCTFYFNLAKRMLINEEACELTALEGAIVFAVDAAHLLERTKYATIMRVQTSYVIVPRKGNRDDFEEMDGAVHCYQASDEHPPPQSLFNLADEGYGMDPRTHSHTYASKGPSTQLRRARITITVQRTENYNQWLREHAHHVDDDDVYDEQMNL